jgi:hypothetical protein
VKAQKPRQPPPKGGAPDLPDGRKAKAASANPKLADQTRKRLGKHYASKYQTMGRG